MRGRPHRARRLSRRLRARPPIASDFKKLALFVSHGDCVVALPPGATRLATSDSARRRSGPRRRRPRVPTAPGTRGRHRVTKHRTLRRGESRRKIAPPRDPIFASPSTPSSPSRRCARFCGAATATATPTSSERTCAPRAPSSKVTTRRPSMVTDGHRRSLVVVSGVVVAIRRRGFACATAEEAYGKAAAAVHGEVRVTSSEIGLLGRLNAAAAEKYASFGDATAGLGVFLDSPPKERRASRAAPRRVGDGGGEGGGWSGRWRRSTRTPPRWRNACEKYRRTSEWVPRGRAEAEDISRRWTWDRFEKFFSCRFRPVSRAWKRTTL